MKEHEWLAADPRKMLHWLLRRDPADPRLHRFAAAYCGWDDPKAPRRIASLRNLRGDAAVHLILAPESLDQIGTWFDPARALPFLRCIFGNPFRPPAVASAWLTSTVVAIARGIEANSDFHSLPILADALQDAGCDDADVLEHSRLWPQPHVRGCWVIELLLSAEATRREGER